MRPHWIALVALAFAASAEAGELQFGYIPSPGPGEKPALLVTPARAVAEIDITIVAGGHTYHFTKTGLPAGKPARFEFSREESVTSASAHVIADFTDNSREEVEIPISWTYAGSLKVDLSRAQADISKRTLTVTVTAPVDSADVKAYGAGKVVLDQSSVSIGGGPGEIEVPWVGDASEIVLLDVTLHSGNAWAGFTYSPWFLDIPHEDVLFATDQAVIQPSEEPKLRATLEQLEEVLRKYGDLVPVKLYVAGCTDTVGDNAHNTDLSHRRARAIASWLRSHGYSKPIFYHGFGESWLAVGTGDGVDEPANRRAVYLVGANPPPTGSGVPRVEWTPL